MTVVVSVCAIGQDRTRNRVDWRLLIKELITKNCPN